MSLGWARCRLVQIIPVVLLLCAGLGLWRSRASSSGETTTMIDSLPVLEDGDYTLVIIPDIQYYTDIRHKLFKLYWPTRAANLTHIYLAQMRWVAAHAKQLNIQAAIFMGDLTQADAPEEWAVVQQGLSILADAGVLFCVTQGDHDLGYEAAPHLPPYYFKKAAHRGSQMHHLSDWVHALPSAQRHHLRGTANGSLINAHYEVRPSAVGSAPLLILCLEYKPRPETIKWADGVLRAWPQHRAIVVTHSYLNHTNGQLTTETPLWEGSNSVTGSGGQGLFEQLLRRHPQIFLVLCGHMDGEGYVASHVTHHYLGADGSEAGFREQTIHGLLSNYQQWDMGGGGWLRYVHVQPNRDLLAVHSFNVMSQKHNRTGSVLIRHCMRRECDQHTP